jgi:hypothetical protein
MIVLKNGMAGRRGEFLTIATVVAAIALVLGLEWSVVKPYGEFNATYYDELADAFLAGQTSLLRLPSPALLALPDPYSTEDNESFRLRPEIRPPLAPLIPGERFSGVHDLALYNGRLYAQWGPVPALMLIPLRALAGHDLPLGYGTLILTTLAELAYLMSAWLLARLCGLVPNPLTASLLAVGLLLCPFWTFNLGGIAVYQIAVLTAQFFVALAFLSVSAAFYSRLVERREYPALLGLASLFVGLALGCHLGLVMLGLMLPVILLLWWRTDPRGPPLWRMGGPAAALALPAGACIAGIFIYNYVRFGNILEIGMSWQLWALVETSMPEHKFHYFSLVRLGPNLLYYFLTPPKLSTHLVPYILPNTSWPPRWMSAETIARYGVGKEEMAGLFVIAPMAALPLLTPLLFARWRASTAPLVSEGRRLGPVLLILLAAALLVSGPMLLPPAVTRYGAEWCMPWIIAGALIAMWIDQRLGTTGASFGTVLFRLGIALNILWTAWVGICFLQVDH